jgi:hypothetical protein
MDKTAQSKLRNLYSSPYITEIKSRKNRVVHVARNGEIQNPYKGLDGNRFGDTSVKWKGNIKMDPKRNKM